MKAGCSQDWLPHKAALSLGVCGSIGSFLLCLAVDVEDALAAPRASPGAASASSTSTARHRRKLPMEPHTPSGSAALWGSQSWLQPAFIRRVQGGRRGFTFVELMVVVSIIVILISVAVPSYTRSLIRAKESVLKNNLFTLRSCIDSVAFDRQKAPQDLRDLVSAGCLAKIPTD